MLRDFRTSEPCRPQRRAPLLRALGLRLLLCTLIAGSAGATHHREVTEVDLKAAFLFKFTQYAEWPDGALGPASAPIEICVSERDLLAEVLDDAVSGRRSRNRPVAVRRLGSLQEARSCHVLFVGASSPQAVQELLASVADAPVLTVGDAEGFAERGGMINLAKRGNRLHFEINRRAVEKVGLQLSSQLLKLATLVEGQGH